MPVETGIDIDGISDRRWHASGALKEVKYDLQRRMHEPVYEVGQWLRSVLLEMLVECNGRIDSQSFHDYKVSSGFLR